jgi:hypothetical protein
MNTTVQSRPVGHRRQLPERLGHQARLQAHVLVAHVALQLGLRDEGRHGVDHDQVHGTGARQRIGDLQGLLAVVRLRDEQAGDVDAEVAGVGQVQGVLRVDVRSRAAALLHARDDLEHQRGLARALRAEDLDDAALGQAADAQGQVETEAARGVHRDGVELLRLVHLPDGALAELLLQVAQDGLEGAAARRCGSRWDCGTCSSLHFRMGASGRHFHR